MTTASFPNRGQEADTAEVIARKQRYLFPNVATLYAEPLVLERGQGRTVWDSEGREYLDFYGGILTTSLAHSHPHVVEMMTEQVGKLMHTSTLYLNRPMVDLAERLARLSPGGDWKSFFTNSGTEANETAILLARVATGNQEVIALRHSYHGRSVVGMSLTGNAAWRHVGSEFSGIRHAHNAYCYRCAFGATYPACDLRCARDLAELIRTETTGRVAALIAEPIQGVGGFITPPPGYFEILVETVRQAGGLFISDEVQTGFGRTGRLFGWEHWSARPDVMTFAKGLANGAAIGATVADPKVADRFTGASISTFGGNPVSMAAGIATLDVIEGEAIPARVGRLGKRAFEAIQAMREKHPATIGDVRGKGLMIGIELVADGKAPAPHKLARMLELTREAGLLIGKGGLYGNVIRLTPPMTVTESELDTGLEILAGCFDRLEGGC